MLALDHVQLSELVTAYRLAANVRAYPTLWRVRLLLTSRVWEPEQDARVWLDDAGQVIGLAFLWRRRRESEYLALERFIHPARATQELAAAMLGWGDERARAIAVHRQASLTLYTTALHPNVCADADFAANGFAPVPISPTDRDIYFARALTVPLPAPALPPGYTLRALRGMEEWEAYCALYGFAAVNAEHQRELLASDEYQHLVIVDAEGAFAAYCECSICRAEWAGGAERIGWIDYVETRAEQQRRGLGRAALLGGLAQLKAWGAETALLVTITSNTPAVALYRAAGFEEAAVTEAVSYQKTTS